MARPKSEIPKILYHATSANAWWKIEHQGLKPFFPAVYMTEDLKAAEFFRKQHGKDGIILEVDTSRLTRSLFGRNDELICYMLKTPPFYHYYGEIPPKHLKKLTSI